jgi:hypothetical protein
MLRLVPSCGALDLGRCPPTSHEVDDHRNNGDDQEQVNQPANSVKCKHTQAPQHRYDNRQHQEHGISLSDVAPSLHTCGVRRDLEPVRFSALTCLGGNRLRSFARSLGIFCLTPREQGVCQVGRHGKRERMRPGREWCPKNTRRELHAVKKLRDCGTWSWQVAPRRFGLYCLLFLRRRQHAPQPGHRPP